MKAIELERKIAHYKDERTTQQLKHEAQNEEAQQAAKTSLSAAESKMSETTDKLKKDARMDANQEIQVHTG